MRVIIGFSECIALGTLCMLIVFDIILAWVVWIQ